MLNVSAKEQVSITTLINMGKVALEKGDFDRARRLFGIALRDSSRQVEYKEQTVCSAICLADTYFDKTDYERAEICYKRALKLSIKLYGQSTMQAACLLIKLAELSILQSRFDEFQASFEKAQHIYLLSQEEDVSIFLNALITLSWALCVRRRTFEAREINEFIVQIKEADKTRIESIAQ